MVHGAEPRYKVAKNLDLEFDQMLLSSKILSREGAQITKTFSLLFEITINIDWCKNRQGTNA